MAAPLGRDTLPDHWSYGVCRDGRVFFINDKTRSTTWLHPRTGEPVNSGHMIRSDLPRGWEEGFTDEGASYFINHNVRCTSFRHPVTGQISPENTEYTLQDKIESRMSNHRSPRMVTESSKNVTTAAMDSTSASKGSRGSSKCHSFGKRDQAIKRNLNIPVVVRGWLYKQDSSGMRLWKRKWFVLSDFCLFYYKDSREETVLGSIPLPSYLIAPVAPEDHVNRKYAFKASHTGMRSYIYNKNSVIGSQAEHCGMRTYFFSADTQEDMNGWIRAMNQAALMQQTHTIKREIERPEKSIQQALAQTNHVKQTTPQSETFPRTDREHPSSDGVRLALGEEGRYTLEVQGRPRLSDPRERLSPNSVDVGPLRNGHLSVQPGPLPSEQHNGNLLYQRGADTEKHAQRKSTLAQVEHWVKVQKGDPPKSVASAEHNLPRRTPLLQPKVSTADTSCQSLPKSPCLPSSSNSPSFNLPSDYKYAHDRLSHFRMSTDERMATKEGMVWQLYEWQQRQQFRHGSPTAPVYTGPNFTDSSSFTVTVEMPRSISVPPSPCEVPPSISPPFKPLSPRRPHTPSGRRTVMPLDDLSSVDNTGATSPGHIFTRLSQTSQMARRSMPAMGYITHTVSAPSLHGKTPEELTLLLIQLRRHQAKMAGVQSPAASAAGGVGALAHLRHQQHNGLLGPSLQADDTYIQLKKDLEYLDLKVTGRESLRTEAQRPVKIAESDADVKLSRLCEQDKILQELEAKIRTLKEDKDKLESVLDVSHQQMEQYRDQPAHIEKIAYQQKLLQEDVVHIRAEISKVSTEMENAWKEYIRLEKDVDWLRAALQGHMTRTDLSQQEKVQMRKELWRIEDVIAGLSSSKDNYKVTISSVTNPERKFVPSMSTSSVPSMSGSPPSMEMRLSQLQHSPHLSPNSHNAPTLTLSSSHSQQPLHSTTNTTGHTWDEEDVPPRPPLPQVYSPDEHPPAVPPLPRETTVIRHTSVRGLKRQSDERKRDREIGQNGDIKVELRPFLSDPELLGVGDGSSVAGMTSSGHGAGYQTLPTRGIAGSSLRLNHSSSISSYVTLRRATSAPGVKERSKSALERLYSAEAAPQRGRMSADEQLERMKRHQKALVRQRKRTLSHGDCHASTSSRSSSSSSRPLSADFGSWRREQEFDLQLLERAVQGEEAQVVRSVQGEERPPEHKERPRSHSDDWLSFSSATGTPQNHDGLETSDYDADLIKELSKPQKVLIPERYVDLEPQEPLSPQEMEDRHRKVERIKSILAKSSVQKLAPAVCAADKSEVSPLGLDSVLQEQERIITMSYMLASEASLKSKRVTVPSQANSPVPPAPPPPPPLPPPPPPPPLPPVSVAPSSSSPLSNGIHYTFV
ncbi:pleckstrin homology domain-containing family A member 7 [Hippocampus comes]|uniref:pleckstrin homology domain-containing family A member 7 n=1 Tax=Hippocampus comes TaxID=109280 RepID=UPI00094EB9B4|nr:PREDICTED: pleckstrin homology domain-containing family A member 7-like [Hippocampus comes]